MKIIFRPIFVVFFVLLALSFSFSMQKTMGKTEKNKEILRLVNEENQRLLLQEAEMRREAEVVMDPFYGEKLLRDQKWLQYEGEQVLELTGFEYVPRTVAVETKAEKTIAEKWEELIGEQEEE